MYKDAKYYNDYLGNLSGIEVIKNDIIVCVPIDEGNSDYAEIMRQVEAGELTIQEAE